MKLLIGVGFFIFIGSISYAAIEPAALVVPAYGKSIQLPADAKNIKIVALKPAQILKGIQSAKNTDCESAVNDGAAPCFSIVSQPIYEEGIELQISYESATQGSHPVEASLGFERSSFSKEQLQKLDAESDSITGLALARDWISIQAAPTTVTKKVVDADKSQFCALAPDAGASNTPDPACKGDAMFKTVTEQAQVVVARLKN